VARKRRDRQVVSRTGGGQRSESATVLSGESWSPRSGAVVLGQGKRYGHREFSDVRRTVLVTGVTLLVLVVFCVFLGQGLRGHSIFRHNLGLILIPDSLDRFVQALKAFSVSLRSLCLCY
jgi:hypothetical protein